MTLVSNYPHAVVGGGGENMQRRGECSCSRCAVLTSLNINPNLLMVKAKAENVDLFSSKSRVQTQDQDVKVGLTEDPLAAYKSLPPLLAKLFSLE